MLDGRLDDVTHPFGELLPASILTVVSGDAPLLRARFAAGSAADADGWLVLLEGAIAAKWRGDTLSTEGERVAVGAAATAVDILGVEVDGRRAGKIKVDRVAVAEVVVWSRRSGRKEGPAHSQSDGAGLWIQALAVSVLVQTTGWW